MTLIQFLLLAFVVYLLTSILLLFTLAATKKDVESSIAKGLKSYSPRKKKAYFAVHYFSSGWDVAQKSPPQFILFVILLPIIFVSWLLWKFFGHELPKDFRRTFPPPVGRPLGRRAYPQDENALKKVLEEDLTIRKVWEIMRPEYYDEKVWKGMDTVEKAQAWDAFERRILRMIRGE